MSPVQFNKLIAPSKLFIILIAFFICACASHAPAPVSDKSQDFAKRPKTHVVVPGDTLFSIAWRYGLRYESLAKHNGISAPYIIRPSQVIRLDVGSAANMGRVSKSSSTPTILRKPTSTTSEIPRRNDTARKEKNTVSIANAKPKTLVHSAPQWRWPANGVLLSAFQGSTGLNKGIDLAGKLGEPVLAAASGQVVYSGSGLRGYGKLLIVKHNENFLSAYAHNDRLLVKEGDFVKAGQRIADMGSSGTDRVKLHFEIRRDGTPVDPLKFLPRR
ncbi:peptidoglycan DD-metalloendopeptidase family protein [Cellvibrio sp. UBA7661]|uniref:peptidoglycan DD-metalloendopeptidase family protein n=1 Tax=Cellvibrio sp. UBA7661 TaxID=1946311 RepID=UPI002F35C35B